MWSLKEIQLTNIASFEELSYKVNQGVTTLIFGNNLDNDSQGSNGSGKSALLEGIALALTGETLRKVKGDEIINDAHNDAAVEALFRNSMSGEEFLVTRILSRKNPQKITCQIFKDGQEINEEETKQSSVAEYNRYVLEKIGLTKDDVFGNFVLSKHKFTSFLSSSDKDKKEMINRFSNAIMVDDAMMELASDISDAENNTREKELCVSKASGSLEAVEQQIQRVKSEMVERQSSKAERKQELNRAIEAKNNEITSCRLELRKMSAEDWVSIEEIKTYLGEIEDDKDSSIAVLNEKIGALFSKHSLPSLSDWKAKTDGVVQAISKLKQELAVREGQVGLLVCKANKANEDVEQAKENVAAMESSVTISKEAFEKELREFELESEEVYNKLTQIVKEGDDTAQAIAALENKLAGVITCPSCSHQFVLQADLDVMEAKKERDRLKAKREHLLLEHAEEKKVFSAICEDIDAVKQDIVNEGKKISQALEELNRCSGVYADINNKLREMQQTNHLSGAIETRQKELDRMIDDMFDEAWDIVGDKIANLNNVDRDLNNKIVVAESSIQTYKKAIDDLEVIKGTDLLDSLEDQLEELLDNKVTLDKEYQESKNALNMLLDQEKRFIEFKTYLANTKIEALSKITNEFLEKIGSDIQIKFSGYTVLKSGKIRDKISISLIRNGLDCGSFDKFSEGEKARVNLANILALNKLTNMNCDEGKGLDLLVLDEILEATDESGLSSIFEALNELKITSLIVSHGNVAENYPYRLLVNKQNGISYVND